MTDRPPVSGEPPLNSVRGSSSDVQGQTITATKPDNTVAEPKCLGLSSSPAARNPYSFGGPGYDSWEQGFAAATEARATPPSLDEPDATWAHVILETEMHEPALLDDETLAEVNEAVDDILGGRYFLDRAWIQPGPLLTEKSDD